MTEVLIVGVAVADIVMRVAELPRAAEKYRAKDALVTVGGCAANAAIAIARHGGTARLAARLGDDMIGHMIADGLRAENVDLALSVQRAGALSSFSSIYVDPEGERQIMNFRGRDLPDTVDLSAAPRSAAVLADNRWTDLTVRAIETARRWSVPAIIDAEAPFDAQAVQGATHIAFSMQCLKAYAPGASVEAALERARADFSCWIAVTDGADGVWYTEPEGIGHVPSCRIEVVDTLGAGDVWHGVFALRLAEGADEVDAIRYANAAAALKCTGFGGASACPARSETEEFLKKMGGPRHD